MPTSDDACLINLALCNDVNAAEALIRMALRRHDVALLSRLHAGLIRRDHVALQSLTAAALLVVGAWVVRTHAAFDLGNRMRMTDGWALTPRGGAVFVGTGGHSSGLYAASAAAHLFARCFDLSGEASQTSVHDRIVTGFGERVHALRRVHQLASDPTRPPALGAQLSELIKVMNETIPDYLEHSAIPGGVVRGAQTTCACLHVDQGHVQIGHVGDCRVYRLREKTLTLLTRDHTLYQEMLDAGRFSDAQLANNMLATRVVNRSIARSPTIEVDVDHFPARAGDRYVLCTHGLHEVVPHPRLERLLASEDLPEETCQSVIDEVRALNGQDPVTMVIIDICERITLENSSTC